MKEQFIKIFQSKIKRPGAEALLKYLENSDFFTAPASTKYHSCYEGGLVAHSVNTYNRLYSLMVAPGIDEKSEETLAIVGLLHDLCKVNFYKVDYRNVKNDMGVWEKAPYYTVDEKFFYGHGEKSVFIISQFMRLTVEEAQAIRFHMGDFKELPETSQAFGTNKLAVMTHIADLLATYIDERVEIS